MAVEIEQEIVMVKIVAAGAAALMIATAVVAYAQQPPSGAESRRPAFPAEDRAAFLEARIAALHAGLRLTTDQEKAWPAFEQAYRDLAALRGRHFGAAGGAQATGDGTGKDETLDPVQHMRRRAEALTSRGAALKRYADSLEPLYTSFDDGQKRRFGMLSRMGHPHFHHFAFWRGRDGFGEHREFGGPHHRFGFGEDRDHAGFGAPRGEAEFDEQTETEELNPPR